MTTGRINQVTGFGLDHDVGANAADVREPGLPRSCKRNLSNAHKARSWRNAIPHISCILRGTGHAGVPTLRGARQRLQTQHRGACDPFQYGTDTTPQQNVSGCHCQTEVQQRPRPPGGDLRSAPSTTAGDIGSLTRPHRNTHTKQHQVERLLVQQLTQPGAPIQTQS